MKFVTPEISWHNRDPIYSVDIQQSKDGVCRLASCGTDKDVRVRKDLFDGYSDVVAMVGDYGNVIDSDEFDLSAMTAFIRILQ